MDLTDAVVNDAKMAWEYANGDGGMRHADRHTSFFRVFKPRYNA